MAKSYVEFLESKGATLDLDKDKRQIINLRGGKCFEDIKGVGNRFIYIWKKSQYEI